MLQDRVSGCSFTRCKHPDCFSILHIRKIYFEGLFLMFFASMLRTGCYIKQMKSIQFFNPSSVIYMKAQVNSYAIANICWLIQTFKYQCCGFQVHFESILVYNLKPKIRFSIKISILHNGLYNRLGLYGFSIFIGFEFGIYRVFIVLNLKCIHAVFAML